MATKLRLAAVGDASALAPVARVARVLERQPDMQSAVVVTIESSCPLGSPLATVQKKLAEGEIDIALCPASRLPLAMPAGIEIGAVLRCRDARYQFLSYREGDLAQLPAGARVVVCDPAARAQILHRFAALKVELSPGNDAIVPGVLNDVWQAAVVPAEIVESDPALAAHCTPLAGDELIPTVGQGLVVVLLRSQDRRFRDAVRLLNEAALEHCLGVERAFLARLAGIPGTVATARATRTGGMLELTGLLAEESGLWLVVDQARAPSRFAEVVALEIADACRVLAGGGRPRENNRHEHVSEHRGRQRRNGS